MRFCQIVIIVVLISFRSDVLHAQWFQQNSGITTPLRGVYFSSSQAGVFVGDNSTVVRTTNGGATWTPQTLPVSGLFIEDADFFDNSNGIIVGDRVFRTTNGGAQWTQISIAGNPSLSGVHFVNASLGYTSGAGGTILKTTNGGANWSSQTSNSTVFLTDVSFANMDSGCVVGLGGTILYTRNGGSSWNPAVTNTSNNLWGVFFATQNIGYAVGGDGNGANGNVLKTTDAGATWNSILVDAGSLLTGVHFTSSTVGYVSGVRIWKTTDGGQSWALQKDIGQPAVLFFADASTGYAGDHSGRIFKTSNGGTFVEMNENRPEDFELQQNYPNPFNPSTTIVFDVHLRGRAVLKIYDVLGREIETLLDGVREPGRYEARWNATTASGGIYFYRVSMGGLSLTKPMVLLR